VNPFQSREIFNATLSFIQRTEADYNKARIRALLQGLFEDKYPAAVLDARLSKEDAEKWERAKKRGADEAAKFVENNFRYWLDAVLLLLVRIGWDVGVLALAEELVPLDEIPMRFRHYNVRAYKRMAQRLARLIDLAQLPKDKGGRPGDEETTDLIESAYADLARSEEEVGQEEIENYLRRKTGKSVSQEAARKRLIRKGKTVSEAKGKERKPRKKK
jgi:hypothetical protein